MGMTITKKKKRNECVDYNSLTEEDRQLVVAMYMNKTKDEFIHALQVGFITDAKQAEILYLCLKKKLKF